MGTMASQITSLTIVYWCIDSGTDQRKHQSSTSQMASNAENVSSWWCHHGFAIAMLHIMPCNVVFDFTTTKPYVLISCLLTQPAVNIYIKAISNELDIIIHVTTSQLSGYCDIITNRLWRHRQKVNPASEARGWCVKIIIFIVIFIVIMLCKK